MTTSVEGGFGHTACLACEHRSVHRFGTASLDEKSVCCSNKYELLLYLYSDHWWFRVNDPSLPSWRRFQARHTTLLVSSRGRISRGNPSFPCYPFFAL